MENGVLVELRGQGARRDRFLFTFQATVPTRQDVQQGGHMIKILLTVAVLVSVGGFAGLAMAQGQQGEAFGSEISSQCAHRRVMGPDPHNDCVRKLRRDAQLGYGQRYGQRQLGYGQGGASANSSDQRDEEQPEVRREQPKTSTSPKVATAPAPKAKKANTPPRLAAQKEQQLYQEFLEWRNRRLFNE
jgi:hypothetical protein